MMKIGILSDTHGNIPATRKAVAHFRNAGVVAVFHCGDIGSFKVLEELVSLKVPVHAVLGNMDGSSTGLKFPDALLYGRFGEIEIDGHHIALIHSDDFNRFRNTVVFGGFDYVFSGHTHAAHDHTEGKTRCINPGAVSKARDTAESCAVLDLESGDLQILSL